MREGKLERLDGVLSDLMIDKRKFASCVVTNERGLVVAGRTVDGSSSQTLAAMISLFSDTTIRINDNLGYGHPKGALIRALGMTFSIHEFMVKNRWFRIGAIQTEENKGWISRIRKRSAGKDAEFNLVRAANRIRDILES